MVDKITFDDENYRAKLLIRHGFIKAKAKDKYKFNKKLEVYEPKGDKYDDDDADQEIHEVLDDVHQPTGFPKSRKNYTLMYQIADMSIEENYYWTLDFLREKFPIIDKLEDSFAAAENSAFFGVSQVRLGGQQDKIGQFLANTGRMVKELFQMVRELRILDERLHYYREVKKELEKDLDKRKKGSEITLKGYFVDFAQGGGKSPGSVYGLASNLEYVTLPDLFFGAPPFKNSTEMEKYVSKLKADFNEKVILVLLRQLTQYMTWRQKTHHEQESRRNFSLNYLAQHYEIIKMYVEWMKPYLRNVGKLSLKKRSMGMADIIATFESSMVDIEFLARKKAGAIKVKGKKVANKNICILATFNFRTRAELKVQQEGYQRGPVHIGKFKMNLRVYNWTDEDVKRYKRLKDEESTILIGDVVGSVVKSMEALGDDLQKYVNEAKGIKEEEEKEDEEPQRPDSVTKLLFGGLYNPDKKKTSLKKALFGDFYDFKDTKKVSDVEKEKAIDKFRYEDNLKLNFIFAYVTYMVFKKSHRMLAK